MLVLYRKSGLTPSLLLSPYYCILYYNTPSLVGVDERPIDFHTLISIFFLPIIIVF